MSDPSIGSTSVMSRWITFDDETVALDRYAENRRSFIFNARRLPSPALADPLNSSSARRFCKRIWLSRSVSTIGSATDFMIDSIHCRSRWSFVTVLTSRSWCAAREATMPIRSANRLMRVNDSGSIVSWFAPTYSTPILTPGSKVQYSLVLLLITPGLDVTSEIPYSGTARTSDCQFILPNRFREDSSSSIEIHNG